MIVEAYVKCLGFGGTNGDNSQKFQFCVCKFQNLHNNELVYNYKEENETMVRMNFKFFFKTTLDHFFFSHILKPMNDTQTYIYMYNVHTHIFLLY